MRVTQVLDAIRGDAACRPRAVREGTATHDGDTGDSDDGEDSPAAQLAAMKLSIAEGGAQLSAWQVLHSKDLRKQLMLGVVLQLIQQLAGINTVMYYR